MSQKEEQSNGASSASSSVASDAGLEIEEETPTVVAAAVPAAAAKPTKKPKAPVQKRERTPPLPSSSSADEDDEEEQEEIDHPKATKRFAIWKFAKFTPQDGTLLVEIIKDGKVISTFTVDKLLDLQDDVITAVKNKMDNNVNITFMDGFNAALYCPSLFWNAVYHFKTVDAFETALEAAGISNGKRRRIRAPAKK